MKNKTYFISEIAQGYEGNYNLAKKLIMETSNTGADIIKFQLIFAEELATKDYIHYKLFKKLEIPKIQWQALVKKAKKLKLKVYFDIFGSKSLSLCEKLRVDGIKIHPTDINNLNLLNAVNKSKIKNVILGIGGARIEDIKKATRILKKNLIIMIGFQSYPTPNNENNLYKLIYLRKIIKKKILLGYADHSIDNSVSVIIPAILLGAQFIEKHFTIKTKRPLEDSESAVLSKEFRHIIKSSKKALDALGNSKNKKKYFLSKNEIQYKKNIQRSLILKKDILKNTKLTNFNLFDLKRTSKKNTFTDFKQIKNKKIKYNLKINTPIQKRHFDE